MLLMGLFQRFDPNISSRKRSVDDERDSAKAVYKHVSVASPVLFKAGQDAGLNHVGDQLVIKRNLLNSMSEGVSDISDEMEGDASVVA